jgi:argininosuccinate lyase
VGIIPAEDEARIREGLTHIAGEIEAGRFGFSEALEDIHMNIEARLTERIGEAGKRLHTGVRAMTRCAGRPPLGARRDRRAGRTDRRRDARHADRAAEHAATGDAGFTHLQPAQPTTFGHHLLAYVEMLSRDRGPAGGLPRAAERSPLGAAALCGTGFPSTGT